MPIKILHTADLHLDSPLSSLALRNEHLQARVIIASRKSLEKMVDFCVAEGVTALLIAGDLYDRAERSAKTAAYLTIQMERLRAASVRVFYIKGNHDAENPITGEIDLPANVHVFDGRGGKVQIAPDVWVHGVSFRDKHAPESLVSKFGAPEPGAVNIAMLHTSLTGSAGHDPYPRRTGHGQSPATSAHWPAPRSGSGLLCRWLCGALCVYGRLTLLR